jgi:hypothetical protein
MDVQVEEDEGGKAEFEPCCENQEIFVDCEEIRDGQRELEEDKCEVPVGNAQECAGVGGGGGLLLHGARFASGFTELF